MSRTFSLRKHLTFAVVAVVLTLGCGTVALLATDLYLHGKYERTGGVNVWGYKGPVAGRKRPGEVRVAVLGGSTAFGYGVRWDESFPAILERRLMVREPDRFSVVNLGYNNEGAYSFTFTMKDYAYLQYDLVCLYEGYNDLIGNPQAPNVSVFRHTSPIFRLTGYLPMFPIVFREKATALLHGGDIDAMYREDSHTVFRPGLAARTTAEVLTAAAETGQSLDRQFARAGRESQQYVADAVGTGCKTPWQAYCRAVFDAVQLALGTGKRALVVTQPYAVGPNLHARHVEQQAEMAAMLRRRFGSDARVAYVNLGDSLNLMDPELSFDRVHLTAAGNARLADSLVDPVIAMTGAR